MRLLVLPGDGIGPEIMRATIEVLNAADRRYGLDLVCDTDEIGFASLERHGTTLRDETLERARGYDGVVLGPISHLDYPPRERGGRNVSAAFRVELDLYANIRPARSRPYLARGAQGMDVVIVREATEGFYPDRNMVDGTGEFMPTPDVALSVRKITARASERIARVAFALAETRRRHVTAIHKANAFILTDGLFLESVRRVHADFPDVALDEVIVDAMAAHLVRDPSPYDVILATNLYGDILSDLAGELSGSLGLAGSINANPELGIVCAQAQHGSAPDIAGRDVANPTSLILSAAMMLRWLAERRGDAALEEAGVAIERAVDATLADPGTRTRDLGGMLGTSAFAAAVASAVEGSA
jgi:3-isopropylmalate dehydrogenase